MADTKTQRQQKFIDTLQAGATVKVAAREIGTTVATINRWREREAEFDDKCRAIIEGRGYHRASKHSQLRRIVFNPNRELPHPGPFPQFRSTYIGRPTPTHHQPFVQAYEDKTNLVIIYLGPPGSGKDTTAGDVILHSICPNPQMRVAWIMETEKFSRRRMSQRLASYLTDPKIVNHTPVGPDTTKPTRSLIDDYGPFAWDKRMIYPDGEKVPRTIWSQHEMYFVASAAPEADPNLWATGVQGALYGSRVDLMVLSDPFTVENQRSPTGKADQLAWIRGTVKSRLDEGGRLIVLGTRVAVGDNYEKMLEDMLRNARPIYQDGYYTKYSNGVATVIHPAIVTDDNGEEASYWPERFPLEGKISINDQWLDLPDDDADLLEMLQQPGAERIRGLTEIRDEDPATFSTLYQQNPPDDEEGEFTDALLAHCEDPTRRFGSHHPGEQLLLGVDPARRHGAAWVLWGWDNEKRRLTLIDYFFAKNLGLAGIRQKLLVEPLTDWMPRWLCYESNRESAALEFPDVKNAIKQSVATVFTHHTGKERNTGDVSVASMALWMRQGQIKFPAATPEDRKKLRLVKQQFQAWDRSEFRSRPGTGGWTPDDICMAAWIAYLKARELDEKASRRQAFKHTRPIPKFVRRRWAHRNQTQTKKEPAATDRDVLSFLTEPPND